jgi:hypothetical protein
MQHLLASQPDTAHETATGDHRATAATGAAPTSTVGPLGGIIFCALCIASYVALVVAVAMS